MSSNNRLYLLHSKFPGGEWHIYRWANWAMASSPVPQSLTRGRQNTVPRASSVPQSHTAQPPPPPGTLNALCLYPSLRSSRAREIEHNIRLVHCNDVCFYINVIVLMIMSQLSHNLIQTGFQTEINIVRPSHYMQMVRSIFDYADISIGYGRLVSVSYKRWTGPSVL